MSAIRSRIRCKRPVVAKTHTHAMSAAFNYVMDWAQQVEDAHGVDKHMTFDNLIFNGGMDTYDGIPSFHWEEGDYNSNMAAIFDYLRETHGDEACYEAFMDDDWLDMDYLQQAGETMGDVVWEYDGVYCCKYETIMSVVRQYYL